MPAPSLHQIARTACVKNIRSITDVGDIPYEMIRDVLIRLKNPEQLRDLEKASPQLIGHDAEIWREFIKRDIENWQDKLQEPKDPAGWYGLYRRLREEAEQDIIEQEEILKASLKKITDKVAERTSKVVDPKSVPALPRLGGMRAETRRRTGPSHRPDQSSLIFSSGSKTKILTGQGVINKARREAKELSLFSARNSILATPSHRLNAKATQLRVAPRGLVDAHKRGPGYGEGEAKRTAIQVPRKAAKDEGAAPGLSREERERRLKKLTSTDKRPEQRPAVMATAAEVVKPSIETAPLAQTIPTAYKVPALARPRRLSPENRPASAVRPPAMRPKAPVDIFMPPRKRKRVV